MAQVTSDTRLRERIHIYLTNLTREWSFIPTQSIDWQTWDEHAKLVFELDWGVAEDQLGQLRGWAADGVLTPSELERYHQVEALVTANRPTLEAMFEA